MERHYRFAGVELTVSMPEERAYTDEIHLGPFAVDNVNDPHVFRFDVVNKLDAPEGICIVKEPAFCVYSDGKRRIRYIGSLGRSIDDAYIRVCQQGRTYDVQLLAKWFPNHIGAKTVLNSIEAEHLIARTGGFVFHCSYIEWNGKAILFTAPSETGKSTQADLWNRHRGAEIINGDRAAVRVVNGQILAEGIPFAGSSQYCKNRSLSVDAIVYLGQAPQTSIRRLRGYEAFARVWEGISVNVWDKTDMEMVSSAVQKVAMSVPIYHLPCTPDESAVIALERALESR